MKPELANNVTQLKNKIEVYRKELDSITAGSQKYYKNKKILELSMALDEIIVEYMEVVHSRDR